ncbi:hypothetical protein; putative exported protein [Frankia alni ACN14a]|uniref:Uncharacterized protein n=1 Tax=Frankia alni (strain DSM 45986 / CECT 9034 / ACN14a) TaxID=326424 RepID=Q0RAN4_FRAAA|nr:hypothetical protein; putative exported protein [Frankia alni ACN14a]
MNASPRVGSASNRSRRDTSDNSRRCALSAVHSSVAVMSGGAARAAGSVVDMTWDALPRRFNTLPPQPPSVSVARHPDSCPSSRHLSHHPDRGGADTRRPQQHAHVADPTSQGAPGRAAEWEGRGRRIARNPTKASLQARMPRSGRGRRCGGLPDGVNGRI